MDILRFSLAVLIPLSSLGCQFGYYMHSAYHQTELLSSRVSIDRALRSGKLSDSQKNKLRLVLEVKDFARINIAII